jgi:spore maturation protein CgeB
VRVVIFCHSLVSDWNHGNAHFLRGITAELGARGHRVEVFEPADGWSRTHLLEEYGVPALDGFTRAFPGLGSRLYRRESLDLDRAIGDADLVLVHEWNEPWLVAAVGAHHTLTGGYRLLFHDTHHRSVTAPDEMRAYDLSGYDGVLAFGEVIRQRYLDEGWARRAWTWHEAADTRVFAPRPGPVEGDLVWIGNWGDDERTAELEEFLIGPVVALELRARVYGVRYPPDATRRLGVAGIEYAGWLPNADVPSVFGRYRVTVHVPRRPYVAALPGIPTIRVFEALACGIPLVSAPWDDAEALFGPDDFLVTRNGGEMRRRLGEVLADDEAARAMAERGRRTVLERHTCAHRVDELLAIHHELNPGVRADLAGELR